MTAAGGSDARRLIPRWRPWRLTADLGETLTAGREGPHRQVLPRAPWHKEDGLARATEVAASALLDGSPDTAANLQHVGHSLVNDGHPLQKLVGEHLLAQASGSSWIDEEHDLVGMSGHRASTRIRSFRAILRDEPRNSLRWVDLGREYLATGQEASAKRAVEVALQLTPDNRFVLRSAVHFYSHVGEVERARYLVRDRETLRDPWLMATHVALAADRGPRHLRAAREMLEGGDCAPWHLGELAAGLATLELKAGRHRQGRALMRQALREPTDNVAAQAEWAISLGSDFVDPETVVRVSRPHEALSRRAAHEFKWAEAAIHGSYWLADQPFSIDAALVASSNALHAGREQLALDLADRALGAIPNHPSLLNNRGFAKAGLGDLAGAARDLMRARRQPSDVLSRGCAAATEGFILFRAGKPDAGRMRYHAAIDTFTRHRSTGLAAQAAINLALEETRLGLSQASDAWVRAATLVERDAERLSSQLLILARKCAHPAGQDMRAVTPLDAVVRELSAEPALLDP